MSIYVFANGVFEGDGADERAQPTSAASATAQQAGAELLERALPQERRGWEDRTLSPEQRLAAYSGYISRELARQNGVLSRLSESEGDAFRATNDYQWLLQESQAILSQDLTAIKFCIRMDTVAQVILDSWYISKLDHQKQSEGFHHLTIPAGVGDIEALKELNRYFAKKNPNFMAQLKMNALNEEDLAWLEEKGGARDRDINQPRIIEMIPIVPGTVDVWYNEQVKFLSKVGLELVPEIEQALVALAFACLGDSTISVISSPLIPDAFGGKNARGASGFSGIWYDPVKGFSLFTASHTPTPRRGASGRIIKTAD
jgi:hypothetical protein